MTETIVADFCVDFSLRNPQVLITLDTTDGNIPANMDAYDIALIASWKELPDLDMIARQLRYSEYALVVSPAYLAAYQPLSNPGDLNDLPAMGWLEEQPRPEWQIVSEGGEVATIRVRARMVTNNKCAGEATDVAHALGVRFDFTDHVDYIRRFGERIPDAKPSLLLDRLGGKRGEIDFINGAVAREAEKLAVPAPTNAALADLVRAIGSS